MQEIASLKRQFAELLSDIGFIKEGLRARTIERMCSKGTDGVLEATGPEVKHIIVLEVFYLLFQYTLIYQMYNIAVSPTSIRLIL